MLLPSSNFRATKFISILFILFISYLYSPPPHYITASRISFHPISPDLSAHDTSLVHTFPCHCYVLYPEYRRCLRPYEIMSALVLLKPWGLFCLLVLCKIFTGFLHFIVSNSFLSHLLLGHLVSYQLQSYIYSIFGDECGALFRAGDVYMRFANGLTNVCVYCDSCRRLILTYYYESPVSS